MGRIIGRTILTLCCIILLVATVHAKTTKEVYLKDGGIIECRKVWQANGKVMVLVNRDILIDLSKDDVDLKKTFAKKALKHHKKKAAKKASHKPAARKEEAAPTAAEPVAPQQTTQRPEAAPGSVVKPITTAEKPVPSAPKQQQSPAAKTETPPAKPGSPEPAAKHILPMPAVQHAVTSAKAPPPGPGVKPSEAPRVNLPLAGPVPPQEAPAPAKLKEEMTANIVYVLILMVIMIVALCMVFEKAGEAWWKAIIPIYNWFVIVKIAGKPWWWGLLIFIPLINILIAFVVNIALAKKFGQGILFGIGLTLVGFVFFPILAFGKAKYEP